MLINKSWSFPLLKGCEKKLLTLYDTYLYKNGKPLFCSIYNTNDTPLYILKEFIERDIFVWTTNFLPFPKNWGMITDDFSLINTLKIPTKLPINYNSSKKQISLELKQIKRLIAKGVTYITLQPELNYNISFLEKGFRKHIEIIVNNNCTPNCPIRNKCIKGKTRCIRDYTEDELEWEDYIIYSDTSNELSKDYLIYLNTLGFRYFRLEASNMTELIESINTFI